MQNNGQNRRRPTQPPQRVTQQAQNMHRPSSAQYPPQSQQPQSRYKGPSQSSRTITLSGSNGYMVPDAYRSPQRKRMSGGARFLLVLLVLVLIAGAAVALRVTGEARAKTDYVNSYANCYVDGIVVDGIPLGGMTGQEGYDAVASQAQARNDAWYVNITYQGQILATINAGQLGMRVDVSDVLNEAWYLGKTGSVDMRAAEIDRIRSEGWVRYTAIPNGSNETLDGILAGVKAQVDSEPVDAEMLRFDTSLAYPFEFREETPGYTLDTTPLQEQIFHMVSTRTSGSIEVQPNVVMPTVTVDSLRSRYSVRASVYTPISKDSTENRTNNIRRCFASIDGYVLQPGKKFSFNSVVGARTLKNGFYEAIEYAYGEHVPGIGGGSCQASTTLYQAAVTAGLRIDVRSPHSDSVSYANYGEDATVNWSGKKIDFVFRNNTDLPIYIVARVEADPTNKKRLVSRVTIYGQDLGNVRYELQSEQVEEIPIPEEPAYRKDTTATYVTYVDEEKKVSNGKVGHVVVSYRVTFVDNVETKRTQLYKDTYKAQPVVIYRGVTKR